MDTNTEAVEIVKIPSRVRINLWLSQEMHKAIEDISSRDSRSLSDLVREALRDFISKDKEISRGRDKN